MSTRAKIAAACVAIALVFLLCWERTEPNDERVNPRGESVSTGSAAYAIHSVPPLANPGEGRTEIPQASVTTLPSVEPPAGREWWYRGSVLTAEGTPVEDAHVIACSEAASAQHECAVACSTDSEGRFAFEATLPRLLLTVEKPGYVANQGVCIRGRDERFVLTRAGGNFLRFLVHREDFIVPVPLTDTLVLITRQQPSTGPVKRYMTSGAGEVAVEEAGDAEVLVTMPRAGAGAWKKSVKLFPDGGVHELLVTEPAVLLTVSVTDERGLGLPGAAIECDKNQIGLTDEQGRLAFRVHGEQRYAIWASRTGSMPTWDMLETPSSGELAVSLSLAAASRLSGQVFDRQGHPIAGAAVRLVVTRVGLAPQRFPNTYSTPTGRTEKTAEDGTFSFEDLSSPFETMRCTLQASHPDHATTSSESIDVPRSGTVGGITLVLDDGCSLRGVVLSNGVPAEASLSIDPPGSSCETNSAGEFVITGLPLAPFEVTCVLDEHPSIRKTIRYDPRPGKNQLTVELDYVMADIKGYLRSAPGAVVDNVPVVAECELEGGEMLRYFDRTDASGAFDISVPVASGDVDEHEYIVRLERWEDDASIGGIRVGDIVDLRCESSVVVRYELAMRSGDPYLGYVDWTWLPARPSEGGGRSTVLRADAPWKGVGWLWVPTGAGELVAEVAGREFGRYGLRGTDAEINLGRVFVDGSLR